MSASEAALQALQGLGRARVALDALWLDVRHLVPVPSVLDGLVHNVVVEFAEVHDALEQVVECHLRDMIDSDPQAMTVANWQEDDDA